MVSLVAMNIVTMSALILILIYTANYFFRIKEQEKNYQILWLGVFVAISLIIRWNFITIRG